MSSLFEWQQPDSASKLGSLYNLQVFINGQFVSGAAAAISVWDHGLLYGDGIFEGIRCYDGMLFKLDQHLDRLYDSARPLGLTIPLDRSQFSQFILETVRLNQLRDAHVRVIVTRGLGLPGIDPRRAGPATIVIMAYPFPPLLGSEPIRVIISSIRRKSPQSVYANIKSLNYLDNILAKLEANAAGVSDAIMLDTNGYVAEATGQNLFVVKDGVLITPTTIAALAGITQATIIDLAKQKGIPTVERNISPGELFTANEAFLTGTASEVVPISQVSGRSIADGLVGPITQLLQNAYQELVRSRLWATDAYSPL